MIINKVDRKNFLKKFEKSFSNFCRNAPIDISFSIGEKEVTLSLCGENETHYFDFSKDVHENIFTIKEIIKRFYPILVEEKVRLIPLSAEKIKKIMDEENLSFDKAFERKRKIIIKKKSYIEKVISHENSFVIVDLESGNKKLVEMRSPIILLYPKIKNLDSKELFNLIERDKKREKLL